MAAPLLTQGDDFAFFQDDVVADALGGDDESYPQGAVNVISGKPATT